MEKIARIDNTEEGSFELRLLQSSDAGAIFNLVSENRTYFAASGSLESGVFADADAVREELESAAGIRYGIYQGNRLVGMVSLAPWHGDGRSAEVSYLLAENVRGDDMVPEALKKVINITRKNYRDFYVLAHPSEMRIIRIAEQAGFISSGSDTKDPSKQLYTFVAASSPIEGSKGRG